MKASTLNDLRAFVAPIADLSGAESLLRWDHETMMPRGGSETRAHQMGTIASLIHERYTDPRLADLLDRAADGLAPGSADALIVRALRRQQENRTRIPRDLVVRRTELSARAIEAWKSARAADDFESFAPCLDEQFALAREYAGHLGYERNPYDALLDAFEPGTSYAWIAERFDALQPELRRLIERIGEARAADPSHEAAARTVRRHVDAATQLAVGRAMAEAVGYSFEHGRLDISAHPFTSGSSYRDVRLTTRVEEEYLPGCLFASIHEAGHGIHSQRLDPSLYRLPFRYGLAIAESQSRFYENVIGRSLGFWKHHYPQLQRRVPELSSVDLDTWYRAINAVSPSLIRVEADEVTYGMHIMLRFELENAVINGELTPRELPGAWNDKMEELLGLRPESDANGVLQDIHWSQGGIGYFPDYLLGSMLSSQLWDALERDHPEVPAEIASGSLATANAWMAERVQRHGGLYTFEEIAEHATGAPFSSDAYVTYLKEKFGLIYRL